MGPPDFVERKNWKQIAVTLDTDSFKDLRELKEWMRASSYSEVLRRAIKITHVREIYLKEKGHQQ